MTAVVDYKNKKSGEYEHIKTGDDTTYFFFGVMILNVL